MRRAGERAPAGSAEADRASDASPRRSLRRRVRAGALADGVRGDRRAARHRDQARAAAARHAAAGRARAVRAARDRALDAAPGAARARPERPPAGDPRPPRRHVRRRSAAAGRAALARRCSAQWREVCDSAWRSRSGSPCSPPSARGAAPLDALDELRGAMDGMLDDFPATASSTCASTSGWPRHRQPAAGRAR